MHILELIWYLGDPDRNKAQMNNMQLLPRELNIKKGAMVKQMIADTIDTSKNYYLKNLKNLSLPNVGNSLFLNLFNFA